MVNICIAFIYYTIKSDQIVYFYTLITNNSLFLVQPKPEPCSPSPCGPNSQCREVNSQAVCSCQPEFMGNPPNCRPECTINSECSSDKACINRKCVNPCLNQCGRNANCRVISHTPICTCQERFTGDPFTNCVSSKCQHFCLLKYLECSVF